jgi:ribonuclease HI
LHPDPVLRAGAVPCDAPAVLKDTAAVITAYIDGGARGNPGPAGYGVRLEDAGGALLTELHGALGIATNNVAEYNGLLAALEWAIEHGYPRVQIRADSELLVKQMRGEYRVKHPGLQPLVARARVLIGRLEDVTFQHVRREQNKEADRLSNLGMDEAEARLAAGPRPAPKGQAELF